MLAGDPTLEPSSTLLGVVVLLGFRARLLLRCRPGLRDATAGTWTDGMGVLLGDAFDSAEA